MSHIGQAPGFGQRSAFRFVSAAGQTVFSGRDANGLVLVYTPGTPTIVAVGGLLLSGPDYTATDGSTLTIAVPLPAGKEVLVLCDAAWNPANTYTVDAADVKFTRKRNRVVNPGMRMSLENGANPITITASSSTYIIDGWRVLHNNTSATSVRAQQVLSGGKSRLRVTALSAADNSTLYFQQPIEGLDIADFGFGAAGAKAITCRFGVNFPAGVYGFTLRNAALNRSFVSSFTIAPAQSGQDVVVVVNMPGDTAGVWASDNTVGMYLQIVASAGAGGPVASTWQASGYFGANGQTNSYANGAVFELFDVGLYEGAVAPPFVLEDYAEDLRKCMRYFQPIPTMAGNFALSGALVAGFSGSIQPMRVPPTVALNVKSQAIVITNGGSFAITTAGTFVYRFNSIYIELNVATAGAAGATAHLLGLDGTPAYLNARL